MSSPFNIILNIFNFYNFLTSENHRLKSPIRVVFHLERPGVVWMRQKTMKSLDDLWSRPSHDAPNLTISLTFFTLSYTWPTLLILLVVEFIAGYTHLHKTQACLCSTFHSFSKIQPSFSFPFFFVGEKHFSILFLRPYGRHVDFSRSLWPLDDAICLSFLNEAGFIFPV